MTEETPSIVSDSAALERLYAPPSAMIQKAVTDRLLDFHVDYLRLARFFCLATGSDDGLDASPRGGPPGFVHVLDPHRIAFADRPGNNRIESLRNLVRDDRIGLLFLFPGLEVFLRINGRARVTTAPDLLERVAEKDRIPKTATVVAIDQVLFHCGKAINRARLWDQASHIAPGSLPGVGKIMIALGDLKDVSAEGLDAHYAHAVKHDLY